jgi:hypothetical protein
MTTAQLEEIITHSGSSEEEIADEIYALASDAIAHGESREDIFALIKQYYEMLVGTDREVERRALRDVIGFFRGYGAPEAAL